MKQSILLLCILSTIAGAQSYLPLAKSNRWYYRIQETYLPPDIGTSSTDTTWIEVLADTLVVEGKTYFTLGFNDVLGGRLVRADSTGIYLYDEFLGREQFMYDTRALAGDTLEVQWRSFSKVMLTRIDTLSLFGVPTRALSFTLEGLTLQTVRISDVFGPIEAGFYGDPPPPFPRVSFDLIGFKSESLTVGYTTSVFSIDQTPMAATLAQNYPNPFNSSTTIELTIADRGPFSISIFNTLGQLVWHQQGIADGPHTIHLNWDARTNYGTSLPTGIYFCTMNTPSVTQTRRLILLR